MDTKPFLITLREYAELTTINGVLYVFHPKFNRVVQFFWFLVGIALIIISILLIQQSYNNWQGSPILTTVSTTGYPLSKIEYPAITICGLGRVDSVLEGAILKQVIGYIEKYHKNINLTLEAGDSYLDLLASAGLHYADFVAEEYPGMPVSDGLTELFLSDARNYLLNTTIQKYQNELQQNGMNYMAMLNQSDLSYKEFFEETYPELVYAVEPQQIILQQMAQYLNNEADSAILNITNHMDEENDFSFINQKLKEFGASYNTFLNVYYPGMSRDATYSELVSHTVVIHLINETYPAMENFQDPIDLFAAYKADYATFLNTKYPGFNAAEANITDIMQQQMLKFIQRKTELRTTLESNQTYKDLFSINNLNYTNFINEMYPGLDENVSLYDLIPLLAAPQPDAFLLSMAAVRGNYTQSVTVNQSVDDPCGVLGNYEFDSENNICYRYAGVGSMNEVNDGEFCTEGEELFSYDSQEQFMAFQKLVNVSVLYCAIDPADRISCMDEGVSVADQYTKCINELKCCWNPTLLGPSCFYSASLYALQEATEYANLFLLQSDYDSGFYLGNALWTNQLQDSNSLQLLEEADTANNNNNNNISEHLFLSNDFIQNDMNSCFIIKWPGAFKLEFFILDNVACSQDTVHVICRKAGVAPSNVQEKKVTLLDNLINPDLQPQLTTRLEEMKNSYLAIFDNLNWAESNKQLFEILWYSQLPCFIADANKSQEYSLIKRCEWKGVELPCAAIFKTFPTDRGMCCTFNMAAAEDIFYNTTYGNIISDMQVIDSTDADGRPITTDYPDFSEKWTKPVPRAGTKKGLSLILDAHSDLLASGSVSETYQGFLAVVGSSNEYPLLNQDSISIRPGYYNLIGITANDVQASEDIKSVVAENRNCYFEDDYKLNLHKNYSQKNCLLECQMEYASSMISTTGDNTDSCTPWFLPKNDSSNICNPWIAQNYVDLMGNAPEDACDYCMPDCTFTDYEAVVTTVAFRKCTETSLGVSLLCNLNTEDVAPPIYAQELVNEYGNNSVPSYANRTINIRMYNNDTSKAIFLKMVGETYDAYVEDIAEVNFYFQSSKVRQLSRDVSMTWTDFAGQIGGFLGLCNGFSICSAVEIFFWFVFRLWYNATKRRDEDRK